MLYIFKRFKALIKCVNETKVIWAIKEIYWQHSILMELPWRLMVNQSLSKYFVASLFSFL